MSEDKKRKKRKVKHAKNDVVVPFKRNLQVVSDTVNPVNFEETEKEIVNQYGKDICLEIHKYSKQFRMRPGFFYYHLLFHLKQAAIFNCSYGEYKIANDGSTNEIGENHAEMLVEEHPELGLKQKKETDTVH